MVLDGTSGDGVCVATPLFSRLTDTDNVGVCALFQIGCVGRINSAWGAAFEASLMSGTPLTRQACCVFTSLYHHYILDFFSWFCHQDYRTLTFFFLAYTKSS